MAFRHLDGQANARANVRLGLLITFAGGLLFTFDLPLFRLAANAGGSAWDLIFARGVFLFLSISVIWWCLKQSGDLRTPYWGGLAGMGAAACNTIAPIAYLQAVSLTGAANVVFIIALIPLMTAALSRLFLGEPVHLWTWLAALLSFAGIALIVRDSVQFDASRLAGDALALVPNSCKS